MPPLPQTVRHRKLLASLRKCRLAAGLSPSEVARQLNISQPKMSRIENGQTRPKPADVEAMLDLYGVTSPERDALLALARETDRRGWWTQYDDLFSASFLTLEDEAETITVWEPTLVPGLLQTEEYARAIISSVHPKDAETVHRRVIARMNRAMILRRPDPPQLHAIISENVLRQQVGGPDVMRRQVVSLWESATRGNIRLQIVPFSAGAHAGQEGAATLFGFSDDVDLDVVHAEGQGGPVYLEGTEHVARIRVVLQRVVSAAMTEDESQKFLEALTAERD